GGQRQRVMIAMALACRPDLIIADEPTTALDIIVQAQILALLTGQVRERQISMIVISHDLSVLGETCDRLAIMYARRMLRVRPPPPSPRRATPSLPPDLVPCFSAPRRPRLPAGPRRTPGRTARSARRPRRMPVRAAMPRGDPGVPNPGRRTVARRGTARIGLHQGAGRIRLLTGPWGRSRPGTAGQPAHARHAAAFRPGQRPHAPARPGA